MDSDRYVEFHFNDLLADHQQIAEALLHACHRSQPAKVTALLQIGEELLAVLSPVAAGGAPQDLRFDLLAGYEHASLIQTLKGRWQGGYGPVGLATEPHAAPPRAFLLVQRFAEEEP